MTTSLYHFISDFKLNNFDNFALRSVARRTEHTNLSSSHNCCGHLSTSIPPIHWNKFQFNLRIRTKNIATELHDLLQPTVRPDSSRPPQKLILKRQLETNMSWRCSFSFAINKRFIQNISSLLKKIHGATHFVPCDIFSTYILYVCHHHLYIVKTSIWLKMRPASIAAFSK